MKLSSHLYLEQLNIPYEIRSFPTDIEKGAASVAHALGLRERQAVKTLIFQLEAGECALAMLGGDQSAVSGNLKQAMGARNIKMAPPEIVQVTTGYAVGSIPPFSWQPPGFRTYLEESLLNESQLGVGAGEWGQEIIITPENLIKASGAVAVNLTDRNRPTFNG